MKVLIAEDDEVSRTLLERLLVRLGHNVASAQDGAEALDIFMSGEFDILITDWMMPKMDGIELCQEIKKLEKKKKDPCYIIMVTTKSDPENMLEALGMGVDDFLTKPVDRKLLEKRISIPVEYLTALRKIEKPRYAPIALLRDEHMVMRNIAEIFGILHDKLEKGIPREVLEWCTSTAVFFNLKIHMDKEKYLIEAFINSLTSEHVDWFSEISQSSFLIIDEEHEEIERCLMDLQGELSVYLTSDVKEETLLKESLKSYKELILKHTRQEENVFFPFIMKYLKEADVAELVEKFDDLNKIVGEEKLADNIKKISNMLKSLKNLK
jgi:CheY-like chemotaxis protein